jgi:hypothetical protein
MNLNPDAVDVVYCLPFAPIIGALKDAGYKGRRYLSMMTEATLDSLITMVGKEYAEGGLGSLNDVRGYEKDPGMLALIDAYTKEYGRFDADACLSCKLSSGQVRGGDTRQNV